MFEKKEYMIKALGYKHTDADEKNILTPKAPINVPKIAPFADWDYYYLLAPIGWKPEGDDKERYSEVMIPKGFVTDLASIPKVLWPILPPTERYTHAAIIHDYHYWTQNISRDEADEIFKIGMKELNVPGWSSYAIYKAVSLAGGTAWENNAKLKEQGESRFLRKLPKEPSITWQDWKSRTGVLK